MDIEASILCLQLEYEQRKGARMARASQGVQAPEWQIRRRGEKSEDSPLRLLHIFFQTNCRRSEDYFNSALHLLLEDPL